MSIECKVTITHLHVINEKTKENKNVFAVDLVVDGKTGCCQHEIDATAAIKFACLAIKNKLNILLISDKLMEEAVIYLEELAKKHGIKESPNVESTKHVDEILKAHGLAEVTDLFKSENLPPVDPSKLN